MKKFLLLFWLTSLFFSRVSFAQEQINITLHWQKEIKAAVYSSQKLSVPIFENSSITPEWGLMPCYLHHFKVPKGKKITVSIEPLLTDTLAFDPEQYADPDILDSSWRYIIEKTGKHTTFKLLPLKVFNGQLIRLIKFRLSTHLKDTEIKETNVVKQRYTTESVLNNGEWYKIGLTQTGVYKIGYADLVSMGIEPATVNPKNIRIYGQYQGMLPEANAVTVPDDLLENNIRVVGEEDGTFDENDFILFFGQGPQIWKHNGFNGRYEHINNLYSDTVFYFLNFDKGPGKRIPVAEITDEAVDTVFSFTDCQAVDNDSINLLKSGKLWVGREFNHQKPVYTHTFQFKNRDETKPVFMRMEVLAKGLVRSYFSLSVNETPVIDSAVILGVGISSRYYAKKISRAKNFNVTGESLNVKLQFEAEDPLNTGWLNFLEFNATCSLKWRDEQFQIRNHFAESLSGKTLLYSLNSFPSKAKIWDVTNPTAIQEPSLTYNNGETFFKTTAEEQKRFMVFSFDLLKKPVSFKKIPNQNLHGTGPVQLVIVAPDIFLPFAQEIASLHQTVDGLSTVVVTPQQLYHEFSSGTPDVSALRNYMRMLYTNGLFGDKPPYLLLFGDGSFDYKNRIPDNTNFILVFESEESLQKTATYGTDDYYGLLDEEEGFNTVGDLDVGIGRFPVATEEEARTVVNKIKHYMINSLTTMHDWRNNICFVADDEDLNLHLTQAEGLTTIVDTAFPQLNVRKIYIDAYIREKISSGYRYPEVNKAIDDQIEKGVVIFNYTGHGGLDGWSAEKILTLPQIRSYNNFDKLPLFITATCEFSRFDDPEFFSAGEQLFLNEKGGAIGLFTTTRLAFAHANVILNRRIYLNLKNAEGNELPRLGDLIRLSKTPSHTNFLNFTLLGDPALRLALPTNEVKIESILNEAGEAIDTVRALTTVTIKGHIESNGSIISVFNGYLYPKIFDKKTTYYTRANSPKSIKQPFNFFDKILFKGKSVIKNGTFEFTFFVPKELKPDFGKGKLSFYAADTVLYRDASGYDLSVSFGGVNPEPQPDDSGPQITYLLNDEPVTDEMIVGKNLMIEVILSDKSGINYTGLGIGRDILLILDDDYANSLVMNDFYQPDLNSYTSGKFRYPLKNLLPGKHTLSVKAWDLQNNSNEKQIHFFVDPDGKLKMNRLTVYPNPFHKDPIFRFYHNKAGDHLETNITIYDINGRKIGEQHDELSGSSSIADIRFDWKKNIDPTVKKQQGIYFYRLRAKDSNGNVLIFNGKMIKVLE